MQYTSVCPKAWKLGLLDCYLNRALNLCTNFVDFKEELLKITKILLKNQYPEQLIRNKINNFLETHKINNLTFKQIQKIDIIKNSEIILYNHLFRKLVFEISKTNKNCF